jgi:hypothetical protein
MKRNVLLFLSSERKEEEEVEKRRSRFGGDKVNQAKQDARGLRLDGVIIIIIIIIIIIEPFDSWKIPAKAHVTLDSSSG